MEQFIYSVLMVEENEPPPEYTEINEISSRLFYNILVYYYK